MKRWRNGSCRIFIGMENRIQILDQEIDIATRKLAYERDTKAKQKLNKQIQKLKLEREIEEIKKRIKALSK